jgi:hypothetical protein
MKETDLYSLDDLRGLDDSKLTPTAYALREEVVRLEEEVEDLRGQLRNERFLSDQLAQHCASLEKERGSIAVLVVPV